MQALLAAALGRRCGAGARGQPTPLLLLELLVLLVLGHPIQRCTLAMAGFAGRRCVPSLRCCCTSCLLVVVWRLLGCMGAASVQRQLGKVALHHREQLTVRKAAAYSLLLLHAHCLNTNTTSSTSSSSCSSGHCGGALVPSSTSSEAGAHPAATHTP